jgi:ATP-dependent Clp protease ATP-binding subunit ClpA
LPVEVIRSIVDIKINIIRERLLAKNIELEISHDALEYLAREGYNPHYGARPLGRLIQDKILNPVATFIIGKGVKKGDIVAVGMKENDLSIEMKKKKIKSDIKVAKPSPYSK